MKKKLGKGMYSITGLFRDHVSKAEWQTQEESKIFSCPIGIFHGILKEETDIEYKVVGEILDDGDIGDTFAVLKSTIVWYKVTKIKIPTKIKNIKENETKFIIVNVNGVG